MKTKTTRNAPILEQEEGEKPKTEGARLQKEKENQTIHCQASWGRFQGQASQWRQMPYGGEREGILREDHTAQQLKHNVNIVDKLKAEFPHTFSTLVLQNTFRKNNFAADCNKLCILWASRVALVVKKPPANAS